MGVSKRILTSVAIGALAALTGCVATGDDPTESTREEGRAGNQVANLQPFPDRTGHFQTFNVNGDVDLTGPFFQSFGTNGRSCGTCHQPADGWTIVPAHVRRRFRLTDGTDPIFRTNDGSSSPLADVSTVHARREAYSMLLTKGLIRVGLPIPANAEFELADVDDPYGYASAAELSLFRRPLPTTNLGFLATVMWDGREPNPALAGLSVSLLNQSNDATRGHAQATQDLTPDQRQAIVAFELGLFTAQSFDDDAGDLTRHGGNGGPEALADEPFFFGINDPLGQNPTGAPFDPQAMTMYQAWIDIRSGERRAAGGRPRRGAIQHQAHRDRRGQGAERRPRGRIDPRYLHHVPRHPQRRQPLGGGAPRHRFDRRRAPHARPAALHPA